MARASTTAATAKKLWETEMRRNVHLKYLAAKYTDWFNPHAWFSVLDPRQNMVPHARDSTMAPPTQSSGTVTVSKASSSQPPPPPATERQRRLLALLDNMVERRRQKTAILAPTTMPPPPPPPPPSSSSSAFASTEPHAAFLLEAVLFYLAWSIQVLEHPESYGRLVALLDPNVTPSMHVETTNSSSSSSSEDDADATNADADTDADAVADADAVHREKMESPLATATCDTMGLDVSILAALHLLATYGRRSDDKLATAAVLACTGATTVDHLNDQLTRIPHVTGLVHLNQLVLPWMCNMTSSLTAVEVQRCLHYPLAIYVIKYLREERLYTASNIISLAPLMSPPVFFHRMHYVPWLSISPDLPEAYSVAPEGYSSEVWPDEDVFWECFESFRPLPPKLLEIFFQF